MILWRLRGIASDIVCSIEKQPEGYRLIVRRNGKIAEEEALPDVTAARLKATLLRDQLISMGFTSAA